MTRVYVRKNGDPSNSGFIYSPFSLISDALAVLNSGDVLDIGPGIFSEDRLSFSLLENITVVACSDAVVDVNLLLEPLNGFLHFSGGQWVIGRIAKATFFADEESSIFTDAKGNLFSDIREAFL